MRRDAPKEKPVTDQPSEAIDDPFRRESGLLVYTGNVPPDFDLRRLIDEDREERMRHVMVASEFPPNFYPHGRVGPIE